MDWRKVEGTLTQASAEALGAFARDHPGETFYGFCLDCNEEYGEVNLSLNTEADLASRAARHYPAYSQQEIDAELRWNPGDWKYPGFNSDPPYLKAWDAAWAETQDAIHGEYLDDEAAGVPERFLRSVCRVLMALEAAGALDPLSRSQDFKSLVTGHDEARADSWARLRRERKGRR